MPAVYKLVGTHEVPDTSFASTDARLWLDNGHHKTMYPILVGSKYGIWPNTASERVCPRQLA